MIASMQACSNVLAIRGITKKAVCPEKLELLREATVTINELFESNEIRSTFHRFLVF